MSKQPIIHPMCCFSREVQDVSRTKIFARWTSADDGQFRQCVVYQMNYKAKEDLAMVLPVPSAPGSGEKALKFINLEKTPDIFDRLHDCFPEPTRSFGRAKSEPLPAPAPNKLEVVQVGSYEASFVPSVKDFARLDERFRLPEGTWEALPQYKTWGFAVFKLKPAATTVHPMAFTFPHAKGTKGLFFPTVHIHDGKVHKKADFDHTLYTQQSALRTSSLMEWKESPGLAGGSLKRDYSTLVDLKGHVHRKTMNGKLANEDVWV
jgi:hypothetical protein